MKNKTAHAPDAFLAARQKNLALLDDLDNSIWQRMGRHAFFGPTSLQELVNLAVQHDEVHLQQIQNFYENRLLEIGFLNMLHIV